MASPAERANNSAAARGRSGAVINSRIRSPRITT